MLVLDLRQLTVTSKEPCHRTPAHLPAGCVALKCSVVTTSGAEATIILGGPPDGALCSATAAASCSQFCR